MRRSALASAVAGILWMLAALAFFACASKTPDLLERRYDGGSDAAIDAIDAAPGADTSDAASYDASGLGAPCLDDAQCDDAVTCTFDLCDPVAHRCRNVPDDTRCDDGLYCNGMERCLPAHGCVAGPVVTCDDANPCTLDRCVEATKACAHNPRDLDGDGNPDDHCVAKHDCNDQDPTVSSTHAEVCGNHKDDNCNGAVDEMPCVTVSGDVCAGAIAITPGVTATVSTVGANRDYSASCSVSMPTAGRDVVVAVVVPPGSSQDLEVWATTMYVEVAIALQATCGDPTTELACGSGVGASSVRARARNVGPGTYYAIVTTQAETSVELRAKLSAPTTTPPNDTCATALPLTPDVPVTVSIIDPGTSLPSACQATTGELTYAITLAQTADVQVYATTVMGSGTPVIGLRAPHCSDATDELFCRVAGASPLFARGLTAGTYVITLAGTSTIDVNLLVRTFAPTPAPPDETCSAPPILRVNQTMDVDLSNHEAAIRDGCYPGGPTLALDLSLATLSDVLLVGRFSEVEYGGVSLDMPDCLASDRLACETGPTPVRVSRRSVPAGDYRIVMTNQLGAPATMTALVRDAVPPTSELGNADGCATVADIPETGGFFVGDTSQALADFDSGCDASASGTGGAPDQVFRLTLTAPRRVVLDMSGSAYTTILDLRQGATCPGLAVDSGCNVGFGPTRSFLDVTLAAGVYFVIVDGYAGAKGAWNLDVRVL